MKFTVQKKEFVSAIRKIYKVIPRHPDTPLLEMMMIKVQDNSCELSVTDLQLWATIKITAIHPPEESVCCLMSNIKQLQKAIKFYQEDQIHIELQNHSMTITCGQTSAQFPITEKEVLPPPPKVDERTLKTYQNLSIPAFKDAFGRICYAVSTMDINPILRGIHFKQDKMAACNNYLLAEHTTSLFSIENPFTLPCSALKNALDILDGYATMLTTYQAVSIVTANANVVIPTLEGNYFKYEQVIERIKGNPATFERTGFLKGLSYLRSLAGKGKTVVVLHGSTLHLAENSDISCTLQIQGMSLSEPIGFNAEYMSDILKHFDCDTIELTVDSPYSPMLLRPKKNENDKSVLCPCRLTSQQKANLKNVS